MYGYIYVRIARRRRLTQVLIPKSSRDHSSKKSISSCNNLKNSIQLTRNKYKTRSKVKTLLIRMWFKESCINIGKYENKLCSRDVVLETTQFIHKVMFTYIHSKHVRKHLP